MKQRDLKLSNNIDRLARELPQEIEPSTDLWPGIEARLETPSLAESADTSRRWPQAAAVGVLLVMASSLATTLLLRTNDTPKSLVAERLSTPMTRAADSGLPTAELLAVSGLSDEDRDMVITSLDIVRTARVSIEQALQKDPNNTALHISWLRVYEQELDLLNDATWTTDGLAERVKI